SAVGNGEFLLYTVNLRADSAGQLSFVGNAPDTLPSHNVTLFGSTTAVPFDEIDFGQTASIPVRQVTPGSLAGFAYIDSDNDGTKDTGESALANVTITLTGTDSFGASVNRTATTAADGSYQFNDVNPGSYKLKETQPTGQFNNLPILDGKDTIGSQGGSVSANDEFTITLAEGVNGTGNNFGEVTGHSLGGVVATSPHAETANPNGGLVLHGLDVLLYATDAQNNATGTALQTATVAADGSFAFNGLTANKYVVQVETPVFLQSGAPQQLLQLGNADSLDHVVPPTGLQARFISYRDFMNSTPRQGIFAAVAPGNNGNAWNAYDQSWAGFTDLKITLTSDTSQVRIDAVRSTGQAVFDQIPLNDTRIRVVGQEGQTRLFRLAGGSAAYNLRPVTTTGSGEGESATSFTLSAPPIPSAADTTDTGPDLDTAPASDTSLAGNSTAATLDGAEGESTWLATSSLLAAAVPPALLASPVPESFSEPPSLAATSAGTGATAAANPTDVAYVLPPSVTWDGTLPSADDTSTVSELSSLDPYVVDQVLDAALPANSDEVADPSWVAAEDTELAALDDLIFAADDPLSEFSDQ
ncbi:MAG: SdrD B-like domain-containing protein, partial [Pirellulaceae bacterium]